MEESLLNIIKANVDNQALSDADFREFVKNSLKIIDEKQIKKYKYPHDERGWQPK